MRALASNTAGRAGTWAEWTGTRDLFSIQIFMEWPAIQIRTTCGSPRIAPVDVESLIDRKTPTNPKKSNYEKSPQRNDRSYKTHAEVIQGLGGRLRAAAAGGQCPGAILMADLRAVR